MTIMRFQGKDFRDVLGKVRSALGAEAVILSTRTERPKGKDRSAGFVEVEASGEMPPSGREAAAPAPAAVKTAAVPKEVEAPKTAAAAHLPNGAPGFAKTAGGPGAYPSALGVEMDPDDSPPDLWDIYADLGERGIDPESAWKIVTRAGEGLERAGSRRPGILRKRVRKILSHLFETAGPIGPPKERGKGPAVANFIGPTGSGKTTTIAKIAAEATYHRRLKVGLVTLDTSRLGGGGEQLKSYAAVLRIPRLVARSAEDLDRALEKLRGADIVLVDAAGRGFRDAAAMAELDDLFGEGRPGENYLVLAANTHPHDLLQIGEGFARVPLHGLVFSKLDESSRFGVIFHLHMELGVPVAYLTSGQKVPRGLRVATPDGLARLIVPAGQEVSPLSGVVA